MAACEREGPVMPLTIACPCGQHYAVEEQYAGQQVSCPLCNRLLTIPYAPPDSARGPSQTPLPPAGASPLAALVATVLIVLVFAGGLAGYVFWLSRQPAEEAASTTPPAAPVPAAAPKEKPPPLLAPAPAL